MAQKLSMATTTFTEQQRMTQLWVWIILLGLIGLATWGLVQQLIFDIPFGNNPMSNTGLVIFVISMLVLSALFASIQLKTTIDKQGINMLLFPFTKKEILWKDVNKVELVTYSVFDSGGFGIRYSTKFGSMYTIKGKHGIAITLNNNKKILIGTQQPKKIQQLIDDYWQKGA